MCGNDSTRHIHYSTFTRAILLFEYLFCGGFYIFTSGFMSIILWESDGRDGEFDFR